MRMWSVNPKWLCRQHLLGEHREMHCAYKAATTGKYNIEGYCNGLVDFTKLKDRHNELVKEMEKRGYQHNDAVKVENLIDIKCKPVNADHNLHELYIRCKDYRERINQAVRCEI